MGIGHPVTITQAHRGFITSMGWGPRTRFSAARPPRQAGSRGVGEHADSSRRAVL